MPSGPEARSGQALAATAIDAVRFSMSTAPRPHTSPSMSSPPNGSWLPVVGVHRHDVGVAHQQQRRRGGIGALDAGDEARATRRGLEGLEVEHRALEVAASRSALRTSPPELASVVDAGVADEGLEELRAPPPSRSLAPSVTAGSVGLRSQPSHGVALPPCSAGIRPTINALSVRPRRRNGLRVARSLPVRRPRHSCGTSRKRHNPQ